jgi:cytochrome c556
MNVKRSFALAAVGMTLAAGIAFDAAAQAKPEDLVKQRMAAMTLMAKYIGPVGAMVQGKVPYDAAVVARNTSFVDTLDKMPWDGFNPSTRDVKDTHAKPDIYSEAEKCKSRWEHLQSEVATLAAAAKGGDQNAVKAAFGGVGKACKACHDDFRRE